MTLLDRLNDFAKVVGHFPSGIPGKCEGDLVGAALIQGCKLALSNQRFCDFFRENSKAKAEFKNPNECNILADTKLRSLKVPQQVEGPQVIKACIVARVIGQ